MKNLILNTCLLLLILASCTDMDVMDSTFSLEVKGFVEEECYTFGEEQPLYLWATKNWSDKQISEVTYEVAPDLLDSYNATEGTAYKILPESCYRIEQGSFSVDDDQRSAKFRVMYSPEQIIAEGGHYDSVEYALPMRISVNGLPMEDRYGSVIVGFRINEALIAITNPLEQTVTINPETSYGVAMTYETNYDNLEWIKLEFEANTDALIAEYNAAHGTSYLPFPAEGLTYLSEDFELERNVNVDSAEFFADMAFLDPMEEYLLPIRLTGISSTRCKIDPERNTRYVIFNNPRIPQSYWRASASSTVEGNATNLVDDDLSTFWMWNWGAIHLPEYMTFMLKNVSNLAVVERIQLFPRQYNNTWQGPSKLEVHITTDMNTWEKVKEYDVALGSDGKVNTDGYTIELDEPVECVGVRIYITDYYDNGVGFFEVYMEGDIVENPNPPITSNHIDQENWTVTTSTTSDGKASNLNDWDENSFWLWKWSNYTLPENITYTLTDQSQTATIESIDIYAYNATSPAWLGAKTIEVQIPDGDSWRTIQTYNVALAEDGKADTSGYTITLDSPVSCKAIRLSVTDIYSDGLAFGEIYMNGSINND